jgi:hypothetical protein
VDYFRVARHPGAIAVTSYKPAYRDFARRRGDCFLTDDLFWRSL